MVPDIRTYKMPENQCARSTRSLAVRATARPCWNERLIAKIEPLSDLFVGIAGDVERGELEGRQPDRG